MGLDPGLARLPAGEWAQLVVRRPASGRKLVHGRRQHRLYHNLVRDPVIVKVALDVFNAVVAAKRLLLKLTRETDRHDEVQKTVMIAPGAHQRIGETREIREWVHVDPLYKHQ